MGNTARSYAERPLKYFFLDKTLYKILKVSRSQNLVACEKCYDGERVVFVWTDVKKNGQRAFHINQVAKILNCSKNTLLWYHREGFIDPPAMVPANKGGFVKDMTYKFHRLYSEDHIIQIWEWMSMQHRGHPRKDGLIFPRKNLPSKAEVLSEIRGGEVIYMKDNDGEFVPIWKA
jgi:hypothetical protein